MYYAGHLEDSGGGSGGSGGSREEEGQAAAGTVTFAGVSLANMYINVTGFAFLIGMSSAVDTLASQQNGARRYEVSDELIDE